MCSVFMRKLEFNRKIIYKFLLSLLFLHPNQTRRGELSWNNFRPGSFNLLMPMPDQTPFIFNPTNLQKQKQKIQSWQLARSSKNPTLTHRHHPHHKFHQFDEKYQPLTTFSTPMSDHSSGSSMTDRLSKPPPFSALVYIERAWGS